MILVGTSGYSYAHWKRIFYPPGLPARRWLAFYASVFRTVELNATFYRLPTETAVERWRDEAPPGFLFAAKGSRYLTHMKRLTDAEAGLDRYFERIDHLRPKLGPILWQLPPQMDKADPARLEGFLRLLPPGRHVFEFRDAAWYTAAICDLLDAYGAAFCEHDLVAKKPPRHTGNFRYVRYHGATGRYGGLYGKKALSPMVRSLRSGATDAYVYFNNDLQGHALVDALDFLELLGEDRRPALEEAVASLQ
ncbi:DUF72 domain-containing protein [Vulgatibacter sp.]|uniref:DUF72 domain-containing protein n=1 Tax=Vulgatibacter sp. TaxID=1971226 RepID=UPI003566325F